MGLITPTFADQQHQGNGAAIPSPLHIVPAHEPLKETIAVQISQSCSLGAPIKLGDPIVSSAPQALKVAIVGTAPSSRMLAPYKDPSWKIWACSPGNMNQIPRYDVWFEIHCNLLWPQNEHYGRPYLDWLKTHTSPVYMLPRWPDAQGNMTPIKDIVPNATPLPWFDLVKKFGRGFFTSSFAWMMALAIEQGAKEISLYGVDMASRDEYILQRPGFGFFRWIAETRGIKISAPHESDIMQPPGLYGFSDSNPHMRKWQARRDEIKGRIAQMQPTIGQTQSNVTYLQGADEDMDYNIQIWGGLADEVAILTAEKDALAAELEMLRLESAKLAAAQATPQQQIIDLPSVQTFVGPPLKSFMDHGLTTASSDTLPVRTLPGIWNTPTETQHG